MKRSIITLMLSVIGAATFAQVKSSATMASTGLGNEWSWLRNPDPSRYSVADGKLRIHGVAADLNAYSESPSFAGIRQQHHDFTAETCVKLGLWAQSPSEKGYADFEYFEYNAE